MNELVNKISAGDYKNSEIQLKSENSDRVVLVIKKFLGKTEIPMDKTTIKRFTHSSYTSQNHELIIEWNDGKRSQALVDDTIYSVLYIKIMGKNQSAYL